MVLHNHTGSSGESRHQRSNVTGIASEPNLVQRVARLENDRDALYELIDDLRAEMQARFAQVDARFAQVDARFDRMDARFDGMDARFDGMQGILAEILRRLPEAG